jgi:putative flavoprotein involved in K+ transport
MRPTEGWIYRVAIMRRRQCPRLVLARLVLRVLFHRVLSVATPIWRFARPKMHQKAAPLIRVKPKDLVAAAVHRLPRVVGVRNGLPLLEDARVMEVANVVWCTGCDSGLSWIDLPIFGPNGEPFHERGIVQSEAGLYFVGLHFLYAFSSDMIHGVGRDAARIASVIAARTSLQRASTRALERTA